MILNKVEVTLYKHETGYSDGDQVMNKIKSLLLSHVTACDGLSGDSVCFLTIDFCPTGPSATLRHFSFTSLVLTY